MRDLSSHAWIIAKGFLFLGLGIVSALLIVLEHLELRTALLLALTIWSFCRFYYFAFYVIDHYVDPAYRFSGLGSFVVYWFSRGRKGPRK